MYTTRVVRNLQILPNPATSTIQLTFNTKHNVPLHCEIINVMGGIVYQAPLPASPRRGEGSYAVFEEGYAVLDVSFLAKGIYIVRVGDGMSFENKKLVIE
jgi:type IX secretion system substrate protein